MAQDCQSEFTILHPSRGASHFCFAYIPTSSSHKRDTAVKRKSGLLHACRYSICHTCTFYIDLVILVIERLCNILSGASSLDELGALEQPTNVSPTVAITHGQMQQHSIIFSSGQLQITRHLMLSISLCRYPFANPLYSVPGPTEECKKSCKFSSA